MKSSEAYISGFNAGYAEGQKTFKEAQAQLKQPFNERLEFMIEELASRVKILEKEHQEIKERLLEIDIDTKILKLQKSYLNVRHHFSPYEQFNLKSTICVGVVNKEAKADAHNPKPSRANHRK
ncbi:hypothetical protein BDZ45DRAFT_691109 [Acephala macrosclerotiorum]|nr:hypothetical protein BDZ45DRAFT_691109 [Acephala macrosclerotiorum]